jgi:hypothetical protein
MPQWLQDGLNTVVTFVPKLVLFLVILLVGWLVAKALEKVIDKLLEKVGFDRAVQRGAVGRAMRNSDYDASSILARVVFYAVLLFALQLAFGVFGPNPVSDLITGIIAFLPKLFIALLIVVIGSAIAGAVADLIRAATGGLTSGRVMATVAQVFIIGLAAIAALNQMGIAVTVTLPVLITVLATIGGIAIVGLGGGLIAPMRQRWERWLDRAEAESTRVRAQRAATDGHPGVQHDGARHGGRGTGRPAASDVPAPGRTTTGSTVGQPTGAQYPQPRPEDGLAP